MRHRTISKQDEKIEKQGEEIRALQVEVRVNLGTNFTKQEQLITNHNVKTKEIFENFTTEARGELQDGIAKVEKAVNDVSQFTHTIGKAVTHSELSKILGNVYIFGLINNPLFVESF